jgi:hypothetical protein
MTLSLFHSPDDVHSADEPNLNSSTVHSQPDIHDTQDRHRFIPNVHKPYYCCSYISTDSSWKKPLGDTPIQSAPNRLTTSDVGPID